MMICCLLLIWPLTLAAGEAGAWEPHIEAGDALMAKGDYLGAKNEFRLAMYTLHKVRPPGPGHWFAANRLGAVHEVLGEYSEAQRRYSQALDLVERNLPGEHAAITMLRCNLANVYRLRGKHAQATELCRRILQDLSLDPAPSPYSQALALVTMGMSAMETGDSTVAEQSLTRAAALATIDPEGLARLEPQILHNLGRLYLRQGKGDQALSTLAQAHDVMKTRWGESHPGLVDPLNDIAFLHAGTGDYVTALATTNAALRLAENGLGADHPAIALALERKAQLLRKLKRKSEATPLEARARMIRRNYQRSDHARHTVDVTDLSHR